MLSVLADSRDYRERPRPSFSCVGLFVLITTVSFAMAQSPQFLPEIDSSLSINPLVRLRFQAKQTREGGDPTQAEVGPSVDFYLKPWIRLKSVTAFDLDEAEKRALIFSAGYRILPSPDASTVQRLQLVATANFPLQWGLLLSDRSRADNDWTNGEYDGAIVIGFRCRSRLPFTPITQKSISAPRSFTRANIRNGAPQRYT